MHFKTIVFLLLSQTFLFAEMVGLASWYGEKFQGRTTASGELFNMYGYTAAHKTLPLGTIVTVTNLKNGQFVNVKVNDRGPYKSNRIMDISYQAAKSIGLVKMGTATVSIVKKEMKPKTRAIVASSEILALTSDAEMASMRAYALMITDPKKEVTQPVVPTPVAVPSVKVNNKPKVIKVQIASSATKKGAEVFIEKERANGYAMSIVSAYFPKLNQTRYKVVILCKTKENAMKIVKSKQYKGAYILR